MHITIISSIDPITPKPGGTRSYVINLLDYLCQKEIRTSLIGASYNKLINSDHKFTFIPIVKSKKISSLKFLIHLLLKAPFLKIPRSSIIHTHREDELFPFVLFHKKNPKVCTLHGLSSIKIQLKKGIFVATIYRIIEKFTLKRIDKIIAVDTSTKEHYLTKYPWLKNKIEVIPVGINLKRFKPMNKETVRKKYGFSPNEKIIIYIGRFEKEKRLDFLLRSFNKISDHPDNYKLVLVGEGKELNDLKKISVNLKLNNVIFMNTVDHEEIPEILNCADVFVLCSMFESGPLVVQEAIACGLPVISTDVGRVREFIRDRKTGSIVEYDENEFAMAIKNVLESDIDYTLNCKKLAEEFSFEKTAISAFNIYTTLYKT